MIVELKVFRLRCDRCAATVDVTAEDVPKALSLTGWTFSRPPGALAHSPSEMQHMCPDHVHLAVHGPPWKHGR